MRVVIFGGGGFIGRHLASHFRAEDPDTEIVLADIGEPPAHASLPGVRWERCDVREPVAFAAHADLVVNLAAVHRTPGHADSEYHETNEAGARHVTEFCARGGIERLWFTSSIAVYGPDEERKTEHSEPRPASAYGRSKLAAEAIHREWALAAPGRRLAIARPATVFGPGEGGNFTRLAAAMKRRLFVYPGRKDTLKACGYVRDLGRAFELMESRAQPVELFNFAYAEPPTIEQVCGAFASAGGLPRPRIVAPAKLLLGTGALLKRAGVSAVDPERIAKLMHSTNVAGEALAEAGFEWNFDLEAGIADWFEAEPRGEFV